MPTFGTVCDGIGCGHLAFNQVGFECAWAFEIEPFPSAVLAYKFPEVKNHGDMNKCAGMVESGEIGAPDVFIGGTPCQAFSVAGKRKGLEDARGNLSLTFCGIADAIDDVRERDGKLPCAVLWENVPGVLSDKGNAFGCFLGELSGAGCQLQPPGGRWRNAGCVFGPKRTVAWRVLDSQFFGVAQRRRRVFVVASAGDGFRPEEVLFEREGVRRDSAPSREAGKGVTSDVGSGSKVGHWDGGDCHPSLTQALKGSGGIGACNQELFSQRGGGLVPDICGCLSDGAHNGGGLNGQDAYTGRIIPVQTYDMRGNGDGETVGTLTGDHVGRPTDYTPVVCCSAEITGPLVSGHSPKGHGCAGVNGQDAYSGRIIPVACPSEVALLSGGDVCRTLSARHDSSPCADRGQEIIAICDAIHGDKSWNGKGWNDGGQMAIAFERRFVRTSGGQPTIDLQPCLRADANTGDGAPCVAFGGDIARTLSARHDSSPCADRGMDVVAQGMQVRRLTPRECERLQALPIAEDHVTIEVAQSEDVSCSDRQNRSVPADEKCRKSPNSASNAAGNVFNIPVWCAEKCFPGSPEENDKHVRVSVRINFEGSVLDVQTSNRLLLSVSFAEGAALLVRHGLPENFVQLCVGILTLLKRMPQDGKAESHQNMTHFTVHPSGNRHVLRFGQKTVEHVVDAQRNMSEATECLKYTTSNRAPDTSNCEQRLRILSSCVAHAISSYIRGRMPNASLSEIELVVISGWTKIPWRGKPAADCPDGPRYKGIGNGQTVNVMRWLAERIKKAIAV